MDISSLTSFQLHPDSIASDRTRKFAFIGQYLYTAYALLITLGLTLIYFDSISMSPAKLTLAIILISYFCIYRPLRTIREIYHYGISNIRNIITFITPSIMFGLVPLFLPITIYNVLFAIHIYYTVKN